MKRRPPVTLKRIVLEFAAVVVLQFILSHALAQVSLLDHLLSPGSNSNIALGVTTAFLLLRMFVLLFAPGWFLARLWLWWSRPRSS
jgi:hypothetical protein